MGADVLMKKSSNATLFDKRGKVVLWLLGTLVAALFGIKSLGGVLLQRNQNGGQNE